jgi:hypothetical protein
VVSLSLAVRRPGLLRAGLGELAAIDALTGGWVLALVLLVLSKPGAHRRDAVPA